MQCAAHLKHKLLQGDLCIASTVQMHRTPQASLGVPSPVLRTLSLQFKEYLSRAEYIKSVIDGQVPAVQAQNGTGQKARGAGGAGGNDKDAVSAWCSPAGCAHSHGTPRF